MNTNLKHTELLLTVAAKCPASHAPHFSNSKILCPLPAKLKSGWPALCPGHLK